MHKIGLNNLAKTRAFLYSVSFESEGQRGKLPLSDRTVEGCSKVEDMVSEVNSEVWNVRYIGCLRLTERGW